MSTLKNPELILLVRPFTLCLEISKYHSSCLTLYVTFYMLPNILVSFSDYQRQWRQKIELLKKKILQLNREERNSELSKGETQQNTLFCCYCCVHYSIDLTSFVLFPAAKEILKLQTEVDHFRQLMSDAKTTTDLQLKGE